VRTGLDTDSGDDTARVGVGLAVTPNDAPDDHVAAIPADDLDAAVGAGVHVQQAGAADGLFANLAERRPPGVVPPRVVAIVRSPGIPGLGVERQTGRDQQGRQRNGQGAGAQHRNLQTIGRR
jgi:hypothetical protein